MSMRDGRILSLMLTLGVASCGDQPLLHGSISQYYNLDYDDIRSYWLHDELVIAYVRHFDTGEHRGYGKIIDNQVVRLTFDSSMHPMAMEEAYEVAADDGPLPILVHHYVIAEREGALVQEASFPEVSSFGAYFSKLGTTVGVEIEGSFECQFIDGNNVLGDFHSTLVEP